MITKFIRGVFALRKLYILLFIAFGAVMVWFGAASLVAGATKDGLILIGFGSLWIALTFLGYRQSTRQEKTILENPIINFMEPASLEKLGADPELADAWNIIAKKTGTAGKKFAYIPGKQWEDLMATDVEAYEAWKKVQEIAKRNLLGK